MVIKYPILIICKRFFNDPLRTWTDAETFCQTFSTSGVKGHLTTIESSDENDFVNNFWKTMRPDKPASEPQVSNIYKGDETGTGTRPPSSL